MAVGNNNDNLTNHNSLQAERNPRICLLTTREFAHQTFRCGFYEGEDVLLDIDDVDLICLTAKPSYESKRLLHERIIWHDFTRKMSTVNMTLQPVKLTKQYDVLIVYLTHFEEVIHVPAIQNWRSHCKTSICWVNELWAMNITNPKFAKAWLPILNQFDHIAFGLDTTAKLISTLLKRPAEFVPTGVDTLRLSPYPEPPARVVDIYNMGRTWPKLHDRFLKLAVQEKLFYLHDTFNNPGDIHVRDYRQHREMFAAIAKRARYFVVAPAKMNAPEQIADQIEVGARYFEAVAAGAVLLGQTPDCDSFKSLFNWPDVVIEIQPDGSDAEEILANLANQPERLAQISRRNAAEALLRHDWLYRWQQILAMAGVTPSPRLASREQKLKNLALAIQAKDDKL